MPPLQVKDCPADVYERLRKCAAEENRSISQQTLTIIEYYLDAREAGKAHTHEASMPPLLQGSDRSRSRYLSRVGFEESARIAQERQQLLERIASCKPIPVTATAPSSDILVRQTREERDEKICRNTNLGKPKFDKPVVICRKDGFAGKVVKKKVAL